MGKASFGLRRVWRFVVLLSLALLVSAPTWAQFRGGGRGGGGRGEPRRSEYPMWEIDEEFPHDRFTFARIAFSGGGWKNDYPDCDWNFSYRLQQLTSLQVDPHGRVLQLTDKALFDHPFIFMSNVQNMWLTDDEALALRTYLLRGGFLMADDFWTKPQWTHVQREMQRVFPNRQPVELSLDHEIFHIVYDLKEIPRIPSMKAWEQGNMFEYWHGQPGNDPDPHYFGYFDDHGRMMAIFCYQADVGDGWEREGENREYFEQFSVKVSYPFGINIVTYAMTH